MESVSVSNLLHVFRKSGVESTSYILVCAYLFQQNAKYTQYLHDSVLLKNLDNEVLSTVCVKNTVQFLRTPITNCFHFKHCFSCWTSMCVLKLKENFQLILNSNVNS